MKVFFDTNVYVAEAILGKAAQRMLDAVGRARWRVFSNRYLVDEVAHVWSTTLGFRSDWQYRLGDGSSVVRFRSRADPRLRFRGIQKIAPILQAAMTSGAGYLVTNDQHLLELNPYEGLRVVSMGAFYRVLQSEGRLAQRMRPVIAD